MDYRQHSGFNQADIAEELEQQHRLAQADAYLYWLFRNLKPYIGERVLEVGCAIGNITQFLIDKPHVVGIDIAPEMVAEIAERFGDRPNFSAYVHDILDPAVLDLAAQRFDTVICPHVLEHVFDDELAMRHVRQLLPIGGRLVLLVPTVKWIWGPLDVATGHQRRYNWREVRDLVARAGFAIEDHWYVNCLAVFGWFVTGRVLRRRVIPTGQYGLYNRLTPLLARLETWVRPPTGLSVVAICRAV